MDGSDLHAACGQINQHVSGLKSADEALAVLGR